MIWEDGEDPAGEQGDALLRVRNLNTSYGKVQILHGVSIAVRPAEVVSIIGPNGAGKSTVLKSIIGLLKPQSGEIDLAGSSIGGLRPDQVVRRGIAYVPQGRIVFREMTVVENLEMGGYSVADKTRLRPLMDDVFALFPRLAERRRQLAGTMSGGEQQMLAMARALMSRPRLICMDEPTMGLAPIFVERVLDLIAEINRSGVTIFMVEQNATLALSIANRGYVLQSGAIVLGGEAQRLLNDPAIKEAYLGQRAPVREV